MRINDSCDYFCTIKHNCIFDFQMAMLLFFYFIFLFENESLSFGLCTFSFKEEQVQSVRANPRSSCKVFLKSRGLDLALYSKAVCNRRLHLTSSLFWAQKGLSEMWYNGVLARESSCLSCRDTRNKTIKTLQTRWSLLPANRWFLNIILKEAAVLVFMLLIILGAFSNYVSCFWRFGPYISVCFSWCKQNQI